MRLKNAGVLVLVLKLISGNQSLADFATILGKYPSAIMNSQVKLGFVPPDVHQIDTQSLGSLSINV